MKLTHLGHACLLVETDSARLLIDPGTGTDFDGLTDLDAVLITHQHADHIDVPRVLPLLAANPRARLYVDPDSVQAVAGLPANHTVARTGDRLDFGGTHIDVLGGLHAPVYGDIPGCTNSAYLVDDGAFFHPGDSFFVPDFDVDVLAFAIAGPWIKVSDAVDHVRAVSPRAAVPIHEAHAADPSFAIGLVAAFSPDGVVRGLPRGEASTV